VTRKKYLRKYLCKVKIIKFVELKKLFLTKFVGFLVKKEREPNYIYLLEIFYICPVPVKNLYYIFRHFDTRPLTDAHKKKYLKKYT